MRGESKLQRMYYQKMKSAKKTIPQGHEEEGRIR
jgi:hypothetical protein